MKLKRYLSEEIDHDAINFNEKKYYDSIANQIKKDSKEWLKESGGLPGIRASRKQLTSVITRRSVRKDRRPLTTNEETHKIMDDLFKKHHGWKARSQALFTQGSHTTPYFYGPEKYVVFPIGKFKYLWSPKIRDLGPEAEITRLRSKRRAFDTGESQSEIIHGILDDIIKNKYKNTGLREVLTKYPNNEIMVKAKEYYIIPYHIYKYELEKRLKK